MEASGIKRLEELEGENRKLKQMFADLSLENWALKGAIEKAVTPSERKALVDYLFEVHKLSIRHSYRVAGILQIFANLIEVREITDSWLNEYNGERPRESLGDLSLGLSAPTNQPGKL